MSFWKAFCLLLIVEVFSLQKVAKMPEEVIAGWRQIWWIWWMMQNFMAQYVQLLNCLLCDMRSGVVM